MLWLLLILVLPLTVFMIWSWRAKQKLIAQFVQSRLLANLTVGVSQMRQKLRLILPVMAVFFLVLAIARPQWGFSWEEARQQGLDVVVAIDTSRSMLAEDLAPNRLTRAKLAALDLMRLAKSDRLGLVAFAGSAFLQCPLTLDEEAFRQSVEALDVGIIPQGGTALTEAIQSALTAFEKDNDNHKVLVLFTDGEDHDSGALEAAEKAAKQGLKIFTIGVGTAEGELIRIRDEQGNVSFLKDDAGNAVKSRLDETLLQKIATAASGFYLPLRGAKPMETLYAKGLAPLPKSDSTTKLIRQYRERYQWPLGIAILLLVAELFLPQRKKVQRKTDSTTPANVTAAIVFLMFGILNANASPSSALREYEAGNFHTALEEFKALSRQKTNDLRLSYNAGAAAYRAKQYEDAEEFFSRATTAPDLALQQQAYYNLGNTLFQAGENSSEPDKKQEAWESSAKNFENSLKLNPQDADAKNNLALVKKKLEELKKQQQQQQQKNQQQKNDQSKDNQQQNKSEQQQKQQNQKQDSESQPQNSEKQKQNSQDDQNSAKKKEDEQKKSEQPGKEPEQKEQQNRQESAEQQKNGETNAAQQAMAAAAQGRMTPEQARQFLDAQKQEDKALIFAPPQDPKKSNQKIKDW